MRSAAVARDADRASVEDRSGPSLPLKASSGHAEPAPRRPALAPTMAPPRPDPRRPVVLLVEDEALVRLYVTDVLDEAGFEVIAAENAEAGLLALHARPDVQVLFTDLNMPGRIDGFALARIARAQFPHVGVLIISGRERPALGDLPPGAHFIPKPCKPEAMVRTVRALAEGASPNGLR